MRYGWLLNILLCCLAGKMAVAAPPSVDLYYTGTVGTAPIQADISFSRQAVKGDCWYVNNPVLFDAEGLCWNELQWTGKCDAAGKTVLTEKQDETQTGRLEGTFTKGYLGFSGTWSKPDGSGKLPVALQAVARYAFLTQKDAKRRITSTAEYPIFFSSSPAARDAEAILRAACVKKMRAFHAMCLEDDQYKEAHDGCTEDYSASISWYRPDFVSILASEYTNTWGTHPNFDNDTYNLTLSGTKATNIDYRRLFKLGIDTALDAIVEKKLHAAKVKRGTAVEGEDKLDRELLSKFLLMPKGMVFVFPRYAVGSYAELEYNITVPYAELSGLLNAHPELSFLPDPK